MRVLVGSTRSLRRACGAVSMRRPGTGRVLTAERPVRAAESITGSENSRPSEFDEDCERARSCAREFNLRRTPYVRTEPRHDLRAETYVAIRELA